MFNKEQIKQLVQKYPYLQPFDAWTGKPDEDYEFDCFVGDSSWLPAGWVRLFLMLVKELKPHVDHANLTDKFYFLDVKEKYGTMRIHATYITESASLVMNLYESFSKYICESCGDYSTRVTTGWISHLCDNCVKAHDNYKLKQRKCMTIELWKNNIPYTIKYSYKTLRRKYNSVKAMSIDELFDYLMKD